MSLDAAQIRFWMIANQPEMAAYATDCGVDRIMVDLESHGKADRQAGRGAWLSTHRIDDIAPIRAAIGSAELLLRTNPLLPETRAQVAEEIEAGLGEGAERFMPPMVRSADEVAAYRDLVDGRAPITPLIETPEALSETATIAAIDGVDEVYFGLNDLHLALNRPFMFDVLADGLIDGPASALRESGVPFGFGGVARVGVGDVPAEMVLGEHVHLGSSSVILARAFRDGLDDVNELRKRIDMRSEIAALRSEHGRHTGSTSDALLQNHRNFVAATKRISDARRGG